jgi:hypothetical protein
MKTIVITLLVLFFLLPVPAFAHSADQPPYMMVGGKYTLVYPVYGSTVDQLPVPNDFAVDVFPVKSPVLFEITEANLPLPPEMLEKITYSWDFGDGTKVFGGPSVSHPYTKPGSYISSTYAVPQGESQADPVLLQATLIHIVSETDYAIPKAVITVNGQEIRDSLLNIVNLPLNKPITFDASNSISKTKIVSYQWDFGDKVFKETKEPKITYHYQLENYKYGLPLAFVVLRVKDENGFIADTYVQINNTATRTDASQASDKNKSNLLLIGTIFGAVVIIIVSFITVKKRKSK